MNNSDHITGRSVLRSCRAHLTAALLMTFAVPAAAIEIIRQDFESFAGGWSFAADPAPFVNASGDVWDLAAQVGDGAGAITPLHGDAFWAIRDLANGAGGTPVGTFAELRFDDLDISRFRNVQISVRYNAMGWEPSDEMRYVLNGVGEVFFDPTASNTSTAGWTELTIPAPAANVLAFALGARQNGQNDWGGFDHVVVTGDPLAVPDPGLLGLTGLGLMTLGFVRARRRHPRRR